MIFYERFLAKLSEQFPETAKTIDVRERVFSQLVCPVAIELPRRVMTEAREIVRAFYALRNLEDRASSLLARQPQLPQSGHSSILMSYDFHVDENSRLRLIEINTNASMSLMTDLLYQTHEIENPFSKDFRATIVASLENEFALAFPNGARKLESIAIVDENPVQQRLYIEFELYRELFSRRGYDVCIKDPKDLRVDGGELRAGSKRIDLVYNRDTDFYLQEERTRAMQKAMRERAACITPHPSEYRLLADKERLLELSEIGAIDALALNDEQKSLISSSLIRTSEVTSFPNAEALWTDRKKYFFKTKNSFGGKAAYRGSSMSRQTFSSILQPQSSYLAQEYVPAPSVSIETEDATGRKFRDDFKYDLRFYVYEDSIQISCARLYKGMMTNVQSPGGGVAAIAWK